MHKKIGILVGMIIGILSIIFSMGVFADIVDDSYKERYFYDKLLYYHDGVEFNYLGDRSEDKYDDLLDWYGDRCYNVDFDGVYIVGIEIEVYKDSELMKITNFEAQMNIIDNELKYIDYIFDGELIYHFKIGYSNLNDEYYEFNGFDICEFYGEYVICKGIYKYYDESMLEYLDPYASVYDLGDDQFSNIMFLKYEIDSTDNEITIDYENPLLLDDIIDTVGIKNSDGNRIGKYYINESNYDVNNVSIGLYNCKVVGIDSNGDIYVKIIYIDAKRVRNPIEMDDITTMYNEVIDENYIIDNLSIDCEYSNLEIISEYFSNASICGVYPYSVTIKTKEEQIFTASKNIYVVDKIPPIIVGYDTLQTDTENVLSYDDILSRYEVNDEYSNDGIRIGIKECNSDDSYYVNNYNVSGIYKIRIEAYDQFNNYSYKDIKLYVNRVDPIVIDNNTTNSVIVTNDAEKPILTATMSTNLSSEPNNIVRTTTLVTSIVKREVYSISTTVNNNLTIEMIKNNLLDNDMLSMDNYDSVILESEYFDNQDKIGVYDVLAIVDGGNKFNFNIEVLEASKSEDGNVGNEKKISTKDIVFYSAVGGFIVVVIIVILILRRKKNGKKN